MKKLFGLIVNSRPYSWGDLVVLGFLAKFMAIKKLEFEPRDLSMVSCLLSLWLFFNFILENRHDYPGRQNVSKTFSYVWLALAGTMALTANVQAQALILVSTFFVYVYLYKNKNVVLGVTSSLTRGVIQVIYILIAAQFYTQAGGDWKIISLIVLIALVARSIAGDIRDTKIDTKKNKQTISVRFGDKTAKAATIIFLLILVIVEVRHFGSLWISLPALVFALTLSVNNNGYVLYQASAVFTTFTSLNLIAVYTGGNLTLLNIVFIGSWLNLIFYPLLDRGSNPIFR